MVKKAITIGLASGLEARPVAMLVQIASQYDSLIYVESENARVNAKSIMGMMVVSADGSDEEKAIAEIEQYLSNR